MAAPAHDPALSATPARAVARLLPGAALGLPRLHLQDGPIDLVIMAEGTPAAVETAYGAAQARFAGILDALCAELTILRADVRNGAVTVGPVARRMRAAVLPLSAWGFITPMAAVAGAVAEEVLGAMVAAATLDRAAVNNGGDIALHLSPGRSIAIGMVARPELGTPDLFGRFTLRQEDPARGLATSGRHGRSFSLGIADAVTVLARTASMADAAATVIANAVDLPGHPAVSRVPATSLQPDSDLAGLPVTTAVAALTPAEIAEALARGAAIAKGLRAKGLIERAALHLQGETCVSD
jgi:ApbE superfamily uncharacterized protein (UPF0280 family)